MKKALLVMCLLFAGISIYASEYGGVVAAPYLNLGVGARPCGMGEAYIALVDNVDAVWWNAGALVQVENPEFTFMHNQAFGGTNYEYFAFAEPASQLGLDIWGTIGITALLVRVEDITFTKENPDGSYSQEFAAQNNVYSSGGTVLGIAYSWQAAKMFAAGATLKLINQQVASEDGWVPAIDIGILTQTNLTGFNLGLVFQNISFTTLNGAPLPMNLKFGVAYKLPRLFSSELNPKDFLNLALDGILPINPPNLPFGLQAGFEYGGNLDDWVLVGRAGYRFNGNQFISDLGAVAGMTVGGGISKNFSGVDAAIDYAFIPYGILGMTNRISMTILVGQPTPVPTMIGPKPPKVAAATAQTQKVVVTWSNEQAGKVKGYNIYMSYQAGGKYYKLTPNPVDKYMLDVKPLKAGIRSFFVVTTVDKAGRESKYSSEVSAVPKGGGAGFVPPPLPSKTTSYIKGSGASKKTSAKGKSSKTSKTKSTKSSSTKKKKKKTTTTQ